VTLDWSIVVLASSALVVVLVLVLVLTSSRLRVGFYVEREPVTRRPRSLPTTLVRREDQPTQTIEQHEAWPGES
jgi:hypothetical protein